MPDVLVIDIAPGYHAPSLSLERYYGIMVESALVVPDRLDHRPSAIVSDRITIANVPPTIGSPWLLLCL